MKQTDFEHLQALFEASETAGHALTAAMDKEVFAMMTRATDKRLAKLAAATEFAHTAYYAACDAYYAARSAYVAAYQELT